MSPSGHFPPAPTRNLPQDAVDRPLAGFTRASAVVGSVGSSYDDAAGIRPGILAR